MMPIGLRLERIMDRRRVALVLAIAASFVATGGACAFAQGNAAAASDSAVAEPAPATAPASGLGGGVATAAAPAADQAVSSVDSGALPSCAVPSTNLPPAGAVMSSIETS